MERVRVARSAIQAVSAHPPLSVVCPRLRSMANPKGLAEEVAEEASEGEGPDLQYVPKAMLEEPGQEEGQEEGKYTVAC